MKIREARAREEEEVQQETVKQGRAIENHLGIDLADPQVSGVCLLKQECHCVCISQVIAATTTIQAGFRGFHARQLLRTTPLTPGIVLHQPRGDSEVGLENLDI